MRNFLTVANIIISIFCLSSCHSANANKESDANTDSSILNKHQLKGYALCSCITHSYPKDTALNKDISFSIYANISDANINVYKTVDSFSKKVASEIKPTQIADYNNKRPLLLGCIEYYESKKLDSLVNTFDKH